MPKKATTKKVADEVRVDEEKVAAKEAERLAQVEIDRVQRLETERHRERAAKVILGNEYSGPQPIQVTAMSGIVRVMKRGADAWSAKQPQAPCSSFFCEISKHKASQFEKLGLTVEFLPEAEADDASEDESPTEGES
jgi:hypothetical protein